MISPIKEILSRWDLIGELVAKDLKLRYSRPLFGFFWAFLTPLLTVVIFYAVFSLILKVQIQEAPFVLYLMSAVFPWAFFQNSIVSSATSLVDNRHLIKEANFPYYLIPISIVLANAINLLPSLVIVIIISFFMLKGLPLFIAILPFVLAVHLTVTLGLSVIFAICYVRWRDTRYILEPVLLLLFYLTPVFYSISLIKASFPTPLFKAYISNPFVGMLNLYRSTLLKGFYDIVKKEVTALEIFVIPLVFTGLILVLAFFLYKKNIKDIYDYLSY